MKTKRTGRMRWALTLAAGLAWCGMALVCRGDVPTPLVEFLFENGTANSGSIGGAGCFVTNNGVWPVISAAGSGVGGGHAMDNRSVSSMGAAGGYLRLDDDDRLDGFKSLTMSFWYRATNSFPYGVRLLSKRAGVAWVSGFEMLTANDTIWHAFGGSDIGYWTAGNTGSSLYAIRDKWVFVALTWNITNGIVRYYAGPQGEELTMVEQTGVPTSAFTNLSVNNASALTIGAASSVTPGTAAFDGMIDNVRIWGSTNDASGVLSDAALQECFLQDDLNPVSPGVPLVELRFDGSLTNSGAIPLSAAFATNNGVCPAITSDGQGASGRPGDFAMDNTSASVMNGAAGYCRLPDSHHLDGLKSLTVSFWYNVAEALFYGPRIVSKRAYGANAGFEVHAAAANMFHEYAADGVNYRAVSSLEHSSYGVSNSWVFFAMTHNVTNAAVNFYAGRLGEKKLTLVRSTLGTAYACLAATNSSILSIAASSSFSLGNAAFKGKLDNVRIWGSRTGDEAALSQAALTEWFVADQRIPVGAVIIVR
ncbi:MAG: hypothetical protein PHR35_15630 [Kiritimatiellae bacterium]|nr:hypothetical protein [Kiritimatiellia bacterium]